MAERELTEQVLTIGRRDYTRKGICPNTGERCEVLAGLNIAQDAVGVERRSAVSATIEGTQKRNDVLTRAGAQSFRIAEMERQVLRDSEACVGACALVGVDIMNVVFADVPLEADH